MRILEQQVIVKVPTIFIEDTQYRGVNGMNLIVNALFNPERHVRTYGIVVSVPERCFATPIINDVISLPNYHDRAVLSYKSARDIQMDIKIGDKVYFHHNTLLPTSGSHTFSGTNYLYSKEEMVDGKMKAFHYFKVMYELVYVSVRYEAMNNVTKEFNWHNEDKIKEIVTPEGPRYIYTDAQGQDHIYKKNIVPIGSWILVQPDMETWEDISIPTPEVINGKKLLDKRGQPIMKPKDQWIVIKKAPEERYLQGWVVYTGSALKGDKEFLEEGMYVYFQKFMNTKIKVEGKDYFRMRQRHIFASNPHKNKSNGKTTTNESCIS